MRFDGGGLRGSEGALAFHAPSVAPAATPAKRSPDADDAESAVSSPHVGAILAYGPAYVA